MTRHFIQILFISLISGFTTACLYDPVYYGPPAYPDFQPHYYDYYYYPSVGVYYHFSSGQYYYRDRGVWVKGRALPPQIRIDAKDRVRVRIEDKKPSIKYNEHRHKYQPKRSYEVEKEHNKKEREANRRWYEDYQKHQHDSRFKENSGRKR